MRPGIAGAVFGAGWWLWVNTVVCSVDAVVCCTSPVNPSPPSPRGITLLEGRGEGLLFQTYNSLRGWLLIRFLVAVGLLLIQDAPTDKAPYGGESMVICRVFVLISGLVYWTSHSHDCVRKFVGNAWGR
ncbi:hypothetical protein OPV22_026188 [Ensete ventricosum]|uniref:Secreted protein n=1 Tax=Ensete ventricosum TaxID=4639 RepID=A0AAV8QJD3_ENSVE|nr:hypothetical protein OPV22_026188 [Ensete ventricosum]